MKPESPKSNEVSELRRRAERLLNKRGQEVSHLGQLNNQSSSHELAVYQIELEMQNEELRSTQAKL